MVIDLFALISCISFFKSISLKRKLLKNNEYINTYKNKFVFYSVIWAIFCFCQACISFGSFIYFLHIFNYCIAVSDIYKMINFFKEKDVKNIP